MKPINEQEAFTLGAISKLAELRVDPADINDGLGLIDDCLVKQASPMLDAGAGAATVALPFLLRGLIAGGLSIPNQLGQIAGANVAELEAEAADPEPHELATRKIIEDYKRQIRMEKTKRNNQTLSSISKDTDLEAMA